MASSLWKLLRRLLAVRPVRGTAPRFGSQWRIKISKEELFPGTIRTGIDEVTQARSMLVVTTILLELVIAFDHYRSHSAIMWNFDKTGSAERGRELSKLRRWLCVVLLGCPAFAASQPGTDFAVQDLRASVSTPSQARATTPVLTPEIRGDIYMARKMYRDAIDMYGQSPITPGINNKIGIAFQQLLEPKLAKKYYEQAIKGDRNFAEPLNNMGTLYYSDQNYGRAISYFKRSLKCSGPIAASYVNLGAAYFGRHDYKRASAYYEQALKIDPNALEPHTGFGTRLQDSVTELALFHFYLARTYAKAGSTEQALRYLRKALEEGLKDRKKLPEIPEFSALRNKPAFKELLAENPKPL
jgi:tetratricopeptide (TPR) repeat protein